MFVQASAEIVMRTEAHGYVIQGAAANAINPAEGLLVDVEAVYELDSDGQRMGNNILSTLSRDALEQVVEALSDAWTGQNG